MSLTSLLRLAPDTATLLHRRGLPPPVPRNARASGGVRQREREKQFKIQDRNGFGWFVDGFWWFCIRFSLTFCCEYLLTVWQVTHVVMDELHERDKVNGPANRLTTAETHFQLQREQIRIIIFIVIVAAVECNT